MHQFIYPTKDTYISNNRVERLVNFGSNQTLAIDCTYIHNSVEISEKTIRRSLLKFDLTEISKSLAQANINDVNFSLSLKATDFYNVPVAYTIYVYPISQSWEQGKGMYAYDGDSGGVNWLYRNYPDLSSSWYPTMSLGTATSDYLTTPSSESFMNGGGTWFYLSPSSCSSSFFIINSGSSLICSQSFDYQTGDINVDVTKICKSWICGIIPNDGFILLSSTELLPSSADGGEMQFFSKDTNTIYSPIIRVKYDDSSYITGSFAPVTSSAGVFVSVNNIKSIYKVGSVVRFDVYARDLYPSKNFNRLQDVYLTPKLLTSRSYYSVIDNDKGEVVIPFDDYTKISSDSNRGNYFVLNTTGFQPERYYRILIKTIHSDGTIEIFDNNNVFKLER